MSLGTNSGLTTGDVQYVQTNYHDLRNLPHPDEEWTHAELDEDCKQHFRMLSARDIIHPVEENDNGNQKWTVWETDERCYRKLQEKIETVNESDGFLPCGHDGFRSHEETLECKRCGARHDKEAVRDD